MIVYFNGEFEEKDRCHIPLHERGWTLGDGVFDTLLAVNGKPVWASAHFQRLRENAGVLRIVFEMNFSATIERLLRENCFEKGRYAVKTTITRGGGMRGLKISKSAKAFVTMLACPAPTEKPPAHLIIASTVRRNEHSPLSQIKSLNYGDNILALMEAESKGQDDAILLNTQGNVSCASASNIFILEKKIWVTPPLSDGVLNGITRRALIKRCAAKEESISRQRLMDADSVVLTNSILGVRPVESVDGKAFSPLLAP